MSHKLEKLFLGAGAMKAGTTWLYALLSKHPEINFTPEKEIHYFAHLHSHERALPLERRLTQFKKFAAALKPDEYNFRWTRRRMDWFSRWIREPLDDEWYVGLFRGIKEGQYAADFSNLTCLIDDAGWEHANEITPHLRVLYIIRHPLDRLWSHIKFHLQVTGESDKLASWSPVELEAFARKQFIWQNGEYGQIVARLRKNLLPEQLMISFFEDIHDEPITWMRRLCQFLGISEIPHDEEAASKPVNPTAKTPLPGALQSIFSKDCERIVGELCSLNLKVPATYLAPTGR